MDFKEINNIKKEEEKNHWWIKTRFLYIEKTLSLIKKKQIKVLEVGCGTCQNLEFLRTESRKKKHIDSIYGVDLEMPEGFRFNGQREKDLLTKDLKQTSGPVDAILAMDVVEHVQNDSDFIKSWLPKLSKDGIVLITVPAFQSLWSYHDEILGHVKRYKKSDLLALAKKSGLEPVYLNYAFSPFFLPLYIIRKFLKDNEGSTDLQPPHPVLNKILYSIGKLELILGGFPFFGTSVIGIFKKENLK